jgi:hypothetical protein
MTIFFLPFATGIVLLLMLLFTCKKGGEENSSVFLYFPRLQPLFFFGLEATFPMVFSHCAILCDFSSYNCEKNLLDELQLFSCLFF